MEQKLFEIMFAGMNPQNQMLSQFIQTESLNKQASAAANIGQLRMDAENNNAPATVKDALDRILGKLGK